MALVRRGDGNVVSGARPCLLKLANASIGKPRRNPASTVFAPRFWLTFEIGLNKN
jgi:hypothetical protein